MVIQGKQIEFKGTLPDFDYDGWYGRLFFNTANERLYVGQSDPDHWEEIPNLTYLNNVSGYISQYFRNVIDDASGTLISYLIPYIDESIDNISGFITQGLATLYLNDLVDVGFTSPADGDILSYNGEDTSWGIYHNVSEYTLSPQLIATLSGAYGIYTDSEGIVVSSGTAQEEVGLVFGVPFSGCNISSYIDGESFLITQPGIYELNFNGIVAGNNSEFKNCFCGMNITSGAAYLPFFFSVPNDDYNIPFSITRLYTFVAWDFVNCFLLRDENTEFTISHASFTIKLIQAL